MISFLEISDKHFDMKTGQYVMWFFVDLVFIISAPAREQVPRLLPVESSLSTGSGLGTREAEKGRGGEGGSRTNRKARRGEHSGRRWREGADLARKSATWSWSGE